MRFSITDPHDFTSNGDRRTCTCDGACQRHDDAPESALGALADGGEATAGECVDE